MSHRGYDHYMERWQRQHKERGNNMWIRKDILLLGAVFTGVLFLILLTNCARIGMEKPPSICDQLQPGDSVLCDYAVRGAKCRACG